VGASKCLRETRAGGGEVVERLDGFAEYTPSSRRHEHVACERAGKSARSDYPEFCVVAFFDEIHGRFSGARRMPEDLER